jgi:hypothetical protein
MMSVQAVLTSGLPFADYALEELREWPALEVCHTPCAAWVGLAAGPRQIVHLHWPSEAELCLTWPVIERLSAVLAGSRLREWCMGCLTGCDRFVLERRVGVN